MIDHEIVTLTSYLESNTLVPLLLSGQIDSLALILAIPIHIVTPLAMFINITISTLIRVACSTITKNGEETILDIVDVQHGSSPILLLAFSSFDNKMKPFSLYRRNLNKTREARRDVFQPPSLLKQPWQQ